MSRHNRRRTRTARNKAPSSPLVPSSSASSSSSSSSYYPLSTFQSTTNTTFSSHPRRTSRSNDLAALHWHNRYQAWQNRDRRQREERVRLEAEKVKLFGGVAGEEDDNDGLCIRMMEYFSSLDFVVEWAPSASFVSECEPYGVVGREAFG